MVRTSRLLVVASALVGAALLVPLTDAFARGGRPPGGGGGPGGGQGPGTGPDVGAGGSGGGSSGGGDTGSGTKSSGDAPKTEGGSKPKADTKKKDLLAKGAANYLDILLHQQAREGRDDFVDAASWEIHDTSRVEDRRAALASDMAAMYQTRRATSDRSPDSR